MTIQDVRDKVEQVRKLALSIVDNPSGNRDFSRGVILGLFGRLQQNLAELESSPFYELGYKAGLRHAAELRQLEATEQRVAMEAAAAPLKPLTISVKLDMDAVARQLDYAIRSYGEAMAEPLKPADATR